MGVLAAGGEGRGLLHQEGPSEHPWVLGDPPTWQHWPCPWHLGRRLPPPAAAHFLRPHYRVNNLSQHARDCLGFKMERPVFWEHALCWAGKREGWSPWFISI